MLRLMCWSHVTKETSDSCFTIDFRVARPSFIDILVSVLIFLALFSLIILRVGAADNDHKSHAGARLTAAKRLRHRCLRRHQLECELTPLAPSLQTSSRLTWSRSGVSGCTAG